MHNLPQPTGDYVERKLLEEQISKVLCDNKRRIITLFGRGGAGKTTLALVVAHKLASGEISKHNFDNVIWVSARNVDLLESGPKDVARDVGSIESIARFIKTTLNDEDLQKPLEFLETLLGSSTSGSLIIIDNFETAENPKYIHDVLEDMVVLPNKVLFTSRTRKLEKDYPLEIHAMDDNEATALISRTATDYNIQIDLKTQNLVLSKSGKIPYIIKLMISNYYKSGGHIAIINTMNDEAVRNALFRTSYRSLNNMGKMIFTSLSKIENEIMIECVAGFMSLWSEDNYTKEELFNVIDDMKSVSLVSEKTYNDSTWLLVPVDARNFATAELEKESFQIQVKPSVIQYIKLLSNVASVTRGEDLSGAVLASYKTCDKVNIKWLDKFVSGMCIYNPLLYKPRAYGLIDRFESFEKSDIREALERAVEYYPIDAELRYEFAKYLKNVMQDYAAAAINAIEASENESANTEYAFYAAQAVNDYLRRQKSTKTPVPMTFRRQLIDGISKRLQVMTVSEKNIHPKLFTQLFWLHVNGGQLNSADQVRQRAKRLFPKDPFVREISNMELG